MAAKIKAKLAELGLKVDYALASIALSRHPPLSKSAGTEGRFGLLGKVLLPLDETCKVQLKGPSIMTVKELLKATVAKAGLGSKKEAGLMEKLDNAKLLQDHRD